MLIQCSRCGAPLDVTDGARRAKCLYCGATSRVASTRTLAAMTPPSWTPPTTWAPPPNVGLPDVLPLRARKTARRASWGALVSSLVAGGVALAPLVASGTITLPFFGKAARWDGTQTLTCGVNESLEIEDLDMPADAPTPPVSIDAVGPNCRVTLRNVRLRGDTLVRAGLNTHVTIEGATLEADVVVAGNLNTEVQILDTRARARSRVIDGGTNLALDVRGDSKLSAGTVAIDAEGNARITIDGPVVIEADGEALVAGNNVELRARGGSLLSRRSAAVQVGPNADVRLDGTRLEGRPALRTGANAELEQRTTEIVGAVELGRGSQRRQL